MRRVFGHLLILLAMTGMLRADQPIKAPAQDVGIDEKLGAQLPLDTILTDEMGNQMKLRDMLVPGKPAILQLSYFRCPMLCDTVSQGLSRAMKELDLRMGQDFTAINISFDPRDKSSDAYMKKQSFVKQYDRPGGGSWRFLVGAKSSIDSICNALGFKYTFDTETDQFSHPAVLMVLSPDGRVMRYLYGVEYPQTTLRLSLVEASEGKIGSTIDRVLMLCFRYSPAEGRYTLFAMGLMRVAGALTVLTLGVVLGSLFLRERRMRRAIV